MLALLAICADGMRQLFPAGLPHTTSSFRLLAVLLTTAGLALTVLLTEYLGRRELVLEGNLAQERLRMAMASGRSAGWDFDVKSGRDVWFGDLKTIFGIAAETFSGEIQDFYRHVHADDRERVSEVIADARRAHQPYAAEFRVVWEDGTVRWLSATGKFYYSKSGEPLRMLGVAVDVTERMQAREALIKSEEKFSKAFRDSPVALTLTSLRNHRYLDVNETFERLTGWERDEVVGRTPADIHLWIGPGGGEELAHQFRANTVVRDVEVRYRSKDGSERIGLGSVELIEVEGAPCAISAIMDITDRKRAEEALRQKEAELAEAQRVAQLGSWRWDSRARRLRWSKELYELCGLDSAQPPPVGEALSRLFAAESWQRLQQVMAEAVAKGSVRDVDLELIRRDGSRRWVAARGQPVRSESGEIVAFSGTAQDITARKLIEDKLHESEEWLRLAVQGSQLGFWYWDEVRQELRWDTKTREMFGAPADGEIRLETFTDALHPDDRDRVTRIWRQALEKRLPYSIDLRAVRPDGSVRWLHGRGKGYYDAAGKPLYMVGIVLDITERRRAEDSLKKGERFSRELILRSPVAMAVTRGPDQKVELVNHKFTELFGYTIEDMPDEAHWWPLAYPDETYRAGIESQWRDRINEALSRHGVIEPMEATVRCKDGSRRHIEFHFSSLEDTSLVSFVDLTDRRRTELELRESEERFRRVVEHIGDALAVDDAAGRVIFANDRFLNLFGFRREELPTIGLADYVAPGYIAEVRDRHDRRMQGEVMATRFEYEGIRRDGTTLWVDAEVTPIKDRNGELIGTQKLLRDATDRKRTERKLRESEERFRLVANTAPVLIWMSGTDKLCTYFNKPWLEFTGRPLQAELGNGWTDGVHPEDLNECWSIYTEAFDRRLPLRMEFRLRRHDGEYRWVINNGVPRFNTDGSFAGYIGSAVDVTEQKQAREALANMGRKLIEAHEEERTWIGRELHDDISQRLALLAVELDRWNQQLPSSADAEHQFHHAQQRIAEIARDVQALSHRLHSSKLDYLGLAAAANSLCKELSDQKKVEIRFKHAGVPRVLPKEISLCLFRVLQEALQNAVKHSGMQEVNVELRGTPEEIELMVADSGVGFEEAEAMNRRGLGLISMRERMQLVDGEFTIRSKPGHGTTIRARVPLKAKAHETRAMAG
jgi:PAS domain S-box-containing protein